MKIVTFACDLYADIAPAFEYLLKKHWPLCPYEVVYVTNSKKLNVKGQVITIPGQDIHFGWRLRQFIEHHYSDNLLLFMMIDYLIETVDHPLVMRAHGLCMQPNIGHVRLRNMPLPASNHPEPGFGNIDKRKRYCLSLQPGIWKTDLLYRLCDDREDPWNTEIRGSCRVYRLTDLDFITTDTAAIFHCNYYRHGRPYELEWVRDNVPERLWPDALKEGK